MSIWFVVLLGLPNSLIWAGIWPLALEGLGRFTKLGSAILIMGLAGNAIMPLIYGHLQIYIVHAVLIGFYFPAIYFWFIMPFMVIGLKSGEFQNRKFCSMLLLRFKPILIKLTLISRD
ncbi:MAG: hypothetical protein ABI172_12600 [Ginsengibacter sp.]|jgi:fucose permease